MIKQIQGDKNYTFVSVFYTISSMVQLEHAIIYNKNTDISYKHERT